MHLKSPWRLLPPAASYALQGEHDMPRLSCVGLPPQPGALPAPAFFATLAGLCFLRHQNHAFFAFPMATAPVGTGHGAAERRQRPRHQSITCSVYGAMRPSCSIGTPKPMPSSCWRPAICTIYSTCRKIIPSGIWPRARRADGLPRHVCRRMGDQPAVLARFGDASQCGACCL